MFVKTALFVALAGLCLALPHLRTDPEVPQRPWLQRSSLFCGSTPVDTVFSEGLQVAANALTAIFSMFSTNSASGDEPYLPDGYFRFIPIYSGTAQQGQTAKWTAPCFKETTATVSSSDATGATIVLEATEPTSLLCSDFYVILTVEGFHIQSINTHGKHEINWKFNKNSTAAEIAWVAKHGFRVFRFMDHPAKLMGDVASTLELFYPVIHQSPSVAEFSAKANTKFLKDYANVTMEPREKDLLDIDESEFQDGDFLGIIRLDGLDTMQVFGTGAHTGHTAMFMHLDGVLHVVESTDKTAYWPNPNIQRTPWSEWKVLAHKADYNVRHLPLSKEARAKFNVTAAKEFFATVEGMPYGYHNFIWGWVDTPNDNWPWPLSTELAEVAFALVARLEPAIADRMWELAFNKRLGTTNLTTMELYTYLDDHKMTFGQLISIPEQDKWVYPDGLSMVCDVFVCAMYKAGGLFGDLADDIQCTEFQNWDVETLAFFDTAPTLPSACAEADPMLPTCQLMGKYRLRLPGFGTVTPYPHMREKCGAVPPEFVRQKGC